jgi:hypothetical protein
MLARDEAEQSLLFLKQTTTLPKYMENLGYAATFWKHGKLYRTYPLHCEDEVNQYLSTASLFSVGPTTIGPRGSRYNSTHAFVTVDGNYVSARWPGDAYEFGKRFVQLLNENTKPK